MNEEPSAVDANDAPISIGSNVRYINTDTIGEIIEIKTDDEGTWALLDTTQLYYRVETLQITDRKASAGKKYTISEEDVKERIKQQAEEVQTSTLEEVFQATGGG
ncbi:DUF2098 domain-containing protein [Methanococcoides methylutens]|uniref:DUF2098 domain-containing protein n=1 Tax=Methanococcoides methylutens MM1 TaxID=1434104 RepID=A0A0E3WZ22_METMT|nr:DUF2098 domain-containing protein [Methanococcoides methylutens]AKB84689.1 hypothetical protein MCMEM_0636 [Methanococcoides methylutens MM1]